MNCIVNYLLALIAALWGNSVYGDFETSSFCIWFVKCWEQKDREGKIGWNEFLAMMKFFTLHMMEMHDIAESPKRYAKLVDMSPFLNEKTCMMDNRQNGSSCKTISKTKKTRPQKETENGSEIIPPASESNSQPRKNDKQE